MDCVIYMFVYAMPSQEITSSKKEHYLYQDPSDVVFTMSSEVNINEAQAHSAHIHSHTDGTLATLHNTNTTSLSITENTLPCECLLDITSHLLHVSLLCQRAVK